MTTVGKSLVSAAFASGLLVLASSCHKDNNSPEKPTFLVSSVTTDYGNYKDIDSFQLDQTKRLASWTMYYKDISNPQYSDSVVFSYNFSTNDVYPASYDIKYQYNNQVEHHELSFDAQSRITRDSTINEVIYYSYGTNLIVIKTAYDYSNPQEYDKDSLFLGNGNIVKQLHYHMDPSYDQEQLQNTRTFNYSTSANPLYNNKLAGTYGPLLWWMSNWWNGDFDDPISANTRSSGTFGWDDPTVFTYTETRDSNGRVSVATPDNSDLPTFTYRYF